MLRKLCLDHPTNPMPEDRLLGHIALRLHACHQVGRGQWEGMREGEVWVRACEERSSPIFMCRAEGRTLLTAEVMDGVGEYMGREQ